MERFPRSTVDVEGANTFPLHNQPPYSDLRAFSVVFPFRLGQNKTGGDSVISFSHFRRNRKVATLLGSKPKRVSPISDRLYVACLNTCLLVCLFMGSCLGVLLDPIPGSGQFKIGEWQQNRLARSIPYQVWFEIIHLVEASLRVIALIKSFEKCRCFRPESPRSQELQNLYTILGLYQDVMRWLFWTQQSDSVDTRYHTQMSPFENNAGKRVFAQPGIIRRRIYDSGNLGRTRFFSVDILSLYPVGFPYGFKLVTPFDCTNPFACDCCTSCMHAYHAYHAYHAPHSRIFSRDLSNRIANISG